jgi:transposase
VIDAVAHGGMSRRALRSALGSAEKLDVTLQALCDRLVGERAVKASASLMSRFLCRIGLTLKRRSSSANKTVPT